MNIIDTITINALWGEFTVKFQCDAKFNFLIGENGTGKTTVINLIAAVLTGDFERLDKMEFAKIVIVLKSPIGDKKPLIEVEKTKNDSAPFYSICYKFKQTAKDPQPVKFYFSSTEQERFLRGIPRQIREKMLRDLFGIKEQLDQFVKVTWLSVHRNEDNRMSDEKKAIPAIDQKLNSLSNELVRYFSSLAKKYEDEITTFQKNILLSILTLNKSVLSIITSTKSIDTEHEKKSLSGIFDVLGVEKKTYVQEIDAHFKKFEKSLNNQNEGNSTTTEDFAIIYDTFRSHDLVQKYEDLQKMKIKIFKSRDNFIQVINKLLGGRKEISLSEGNDLLFKTKNGHKILINELSSGEKQLLIILGEALLQEENYVIYIADEPELSLHITWQETLTDYISELNPNAQILFATHSPDIVGRHSDKIIAMEEVIK